VSSQLHVPASLLRQKSPRHPLGRGMSGTQSRSGRGGGEKISQPLSVIEIQSTYSWCSHSVTHFLLTCKPDVLSKHTESTIKSILPRFPYFVRLSMYQNVRLSVSTNNTHTHCNFGISCHLCNYYVIPANINTNMAALWACVAWDLRKVCSWTDIVLQQKIRDRNRKWSWQPAWTRYVRRDGGPVGGGRDVRVGGEVRSIQCVVLLAVEATHPYPVQPSVRLSVCPRLPEMTARIWEPYQALQF
jgi:hypothetical protein